MDKIKAGIVTITSENNYGGVLQRYGLQRTLQRFGVDVKSIIFYPPRPRKKKNLNRFFSVKRLIDKIRNMPYRTLYRSFEKKQRRQRTEAFKNFASRFLIETELLRSYDEVVKEGECFDVTIAGSDQIWNTTWHFDEVFSRYYMLDFIPNDRKISYAASLGLSQIPDEFVPKFQRYLSNFSWISVRENEGAKELEKILNRPIDVVLDPTMLLSLEEWDVLANHPSTSGRQESPYVLCYSLGNPTDVFRKARQIQKYHNIPILYLCETAREYLFLKSQSAFVKPILNVGPEEFVSLFKQSAYVVTDSFHGSVFSIMFHKPFFTMMRDKEEPTKSMNSRISTLFSTFRLESRLFSPEDESPLTPESFEINYEAVDKILQERRKDSLDKLQKALENVVKSNANA